MASSKESKRKGQRTKVEVTAKAAKDYRPPERDSPTRYPKPNIRVHSFILDKKGPKEKRPMTMSDLPIPKGG